jgi:hypothetical protein
MEGSTNECDVNVDDELERIEQSHVAEQAVWDESFRSVLADFEEEHLRNASKSRACEPSPPPLPAILVSGEVNFPDSHLSHGEPTKRK